MAYGLAESTLSEMVVISHGFIKKTAKVPQGEIQRALDRKRLFEQNPDLHTQEIRDA